MFAFDCLRLDLLGAKRAFLGGHDVLLSDLVRGNPSIDDLIMEIRRDGPGERKGSAGRESVSTRRPENRWNRFDRLGSALFSKYNQVGSGTLLKSFGRKKPDENPFRITCELDATEHLRWARHRAHSWRRSV
jgi:hypothetical protein